MSAYLDNSATTKPCKECVEAVNKMLTECYGNPSSFHNDGVMAMKEVIKARESLANALSCDSSEIYFTSGGTESNNLAIFGAAYAKRKLGNRIVTTEIEHESVLESINELEKEGFEVIRLKPNKFGNIDEKDIFDAINKDTILVSMMYINNEVGSVLPVKAVAKAIKKADAPALIHIDCVQAFGKVPIKPYKLGADLLTVTAHKIHGPKGSGALFVKKGTYIVPRTYGGEQEKRLRPGTESSPLIAGFGAAVEALPNLNAQKEKIEKINQYAKEQLLSIGATINSGENASPYIINTTIEGIRSQTLIQFLSSKGISVSSGSACAKGKKSHVLTAMGLDGDIIDSAIRISFSRYNTKEDVDELIFALKDAQNTLSRR